jgi:hypothetical protein
MRSEVVVRPATASTLARPRDAARLKQIPQTPDKNVWFPLASPIDAEIMDLIGNLGALRNPTTVRTGTHGTRRKRKIAIVQVDGSGRIANVMLDTVASFLARLSIVTLQRP